MLMVPGGATACTADKMKTTDDGFLFKVVGGSDKVEAKKAPGSKDKAFSLGLLFPYYVICEEDQFYKITNLGAEIVREAVTGRVGYVLKDQVYPWPTREALDFSVATFNSKRSEIVAWDDEEALLKFLETGNQKVAPPAFQEDLAWTLDDSKRTARLRPYPVLSSKVMLGKKRVFRVLLPVSLPAEAKVVTTPDKGSPQEEKKEPEKVLRSATFCIVFDATASIGPFVKDIAADIKAAFDSLPPDVANSSTVGFVFYRDEGNEEKYFMSSPLNVGDAMKVLTEAAAKGYIWQGGGDPHKPALDAVYIGHHFFKWNEGKGGGRRIMLAVLSDDAKPRTTGKIHDGVPPGLEPAKIAADLLAEGIKTITVQAGPGAGEHLIPVLTKLAESTGGTFVEWGSGGDERRKKVTAAIASQLKAERTFAEVRDRWGPLQFDYVSYTIRLTILDQQKRQRLRSAAVKFNIDPGKGGILIQESYILEDSDLFELKAQVETK
jgi:hypothetical protein